MVTKQVHQWVGTGQTSGAATLTMSDPNSVATPSNSAVGVRAHYVGRDSATGNTVRVVVEGSFQNAAGTASLQGSLSLPTPIGNAALTGAIGAIDVSGATITAKITGIVLLTMDWMVHVEWIAYAP